MPKQITVNEMHKAFASLKRKGYGDAYIIVADDNEGNGFHGQFFLPEALDKIKGAEHILNVLSDSETDPHKLVVM